MASAFFRQSPRAALTPGTFHVRFSLLSDFAFLSAAVLLTALGLGLRFGIADRPDPVADERIARLERRVERLRELSDRVRRLEDEWVRKRRGGAAGSAEPGRAGSKRTGRADAPQGSPPRRSPLPVGAPSRLGDALEAVSSEILVDRVRAILGPIGAKPDERRAVTAAYDRERRERSDAARRRFSDGLDAGTVSELHMAARDRRLASIRETLGNSRFERIRSVLPDPTPEFEELLGGPR